MGFLGNDKIEKTEQQQQQPRKSKWTDRGPFYVESGASYSEACKQQIDGRLMKSLGLDDLDDLFEMKAPVFDKRIKTLGHNVHVICTYCEIFAEELKKQQTALNQLTEKLDALQQLSEQINDLKRQLDNSSSLSR